MTLKKNILQLLADSKKPLSVSDISDQLPSQPADEGLNTALEQLSESGRIYQNKARRYALPSDLNLVVGRLDSTRKGSGFVVPDHRAEDQSDVFVPAHKIATAVHGDRVVVRMENKRRRSSPEGSVVRVLERARTRLVGTLKRGRHFGFVEPDEERLNFEVYLPKSEAQKANEGDKVVVKIENWGDQKKSPEGEIIDVLGAADDPGVDVLSIIESHGLDRDFPAKVDEAAGRLKADFQKEAKTRKDLRDLLVLTIDPDDAKDFDDALSIERVGDDRYRVGIHIADVSHYVTPDSVIDQEAYRRATSVYLIDRVVPMLPEALSNELCSLKPGVDRLAYSVFLTLDKEAEIVETEFCETIINSRHRLTYTEAQSLLEADPPREELKAVIWEVQTLRRLAKLLQAARAKKGSLDFDLPTTVVELNDEGVPIDLEESVRLDSMRLVEEFMLAANQAVARRASELEVPFMYRVHDRPPVGKVEKVKDYVTALGYTTQGEPGEPKFFAHLLKQSKGRKERQLVQALVLRCMEQARYRTDNVGHFGLASRSYTHFTSPIRRYPDLVVHRLLKEIESGERWKSDKKRESTLENLDQVAHHCSTQERNAADAERDSIALKKVEFMERHLKEEFPGVISAVKSFGFFVRLDDLLVDGMVSVHDLDDDYYEYQEDQYALEGRNTGRRFRLGDAVTVSVDAVDKQKRQIDFGLVAP